MKIQELLSNYKIYKQKNSSQIKFPIISYFTERNMEEIMGFYVEEELTEEDNILSHFELLYELEYKYNMLKTHQFRGLSQRYENILNLIAKKSQKVIISLAKTFKNVFGKWLKGHAITNPEEWAKARVQDDLGYGEYEIEVLFDSMFGEFLRYKDNIDFRTPESVKESIFLKEVIKKLDKMPNLKKILISEAKEYTYDLAKSNLEDVESGYEELSDWNEQFELNASSVEEAFNMIYEIKPDLDNYLDLLPDFGFEEFFKNLINEESLIELYREIVFPLWFDYWRAQGIEVTREGIENMYKHLKYITRKPLEKQFMLLNIVKNISHQSGSMMEYYEEMYGVMAQDLESLSNMDVTLWNKELKQIGMV